MVKTRMCLLQQNEKNDSKLAHIIEPHEVGPLLEKNQNDKKACEIDFKKKYGQLIYLRTLIKVLNPFFYDLFYF